MDPEVSTHRTESVGGMSIPLVRAMAARRHWRRDKSRSLTISLDDEEEIEMEETENLGKDPRRESRHPSVAGHERVVFKKRTCRKFAKRRGGRGDSIRSTSVASTRCWCGRTYGEHKTNADTAANEPNSAVVEVVETIDRWETYYKLCSDAVDDSDAYGIVKFTVDGNTEHDYWFTEEKQRYVRFDKDTSVHHVFDRLLRDEHEWNLGDPGLIVSVVGDVDYGGAYGENGVKEAFRSCLLSIFSDTPNSWVLTGGTYSGIGKFVGEVVKEINMTKNKVEEKSENVNVTCIGVANWGIVKNKEILVDPDSKRRPKQFSRTVTYDVATTGSATYSYGSDRGRYEEYLDPHHTHFLLIDDGTVGKLDDAIPFSFRDKIMEISSCPCANLLFGGDINALDDIIHSLTKTARASKSTSSSFDELEGDYGTPCIVMKGSGKAADLIALGMELLEAKRKSENVKEYIADIVNSKAMKDKIESECGDVKNVKWRLKKCLENHHLIYIFDPSVDETVNVEVLKAFHRHGRASIKEKFEVAYQWNKIEVASEMWRDMIGGEQLSSEKWVIKALAVGNLDFVKLFLSHACDNGNFLTQSQLKILYTKCTRKAKKRCIEKYLEGETAVEINGFESYMKRLADFYAENQEKDLDMGKPRYMMQDPKFNTMLTSAHFNSDGGDHDKKCYNQTLADLFVWCIFVGHYDIAHWLMKCARHPTAFGLMASNILRGLVFYVETKTEILELEEKAAEFEQYSVDVLYKCYITDPLKAKFVLVQGLEVFDKTSCMELAARDKHCLEFICHPASQSHLTDIWRRCHKKGKLTYILVTFFAVVAWAQLVASPFTYEHAEKTFQSSTMAALVIAFAIFLTLVIIIVIAVKGMKTMRHVKTMAKDFKELKGLDATNDFLFSIGIECGYAKSSSGRTDCNRDVADFFRSPVLKLYLHCTSYAAYLLVYVYFLLFDTHAGFVSQPPSSFEGMIYIFWISYITQEVKQVSKNDLSAPLHQTRWKPWLRHARSSFSLYFRSAWNWYDIILLISTTMISFSRLALYLSEPGPMHTNGEQYLTLAYSVVFALFLIRLLQFFLASIHLGPKLLMIAQMLYDLSNFAIFLVIFLCAFSLVSHTMLEVLNDDQERKMSLDLIANLLRRGFWNLFGETFLEEYSEMYKLIESKNATAQLKLPTYAEVSTKLLVPFLQGIYMFVTVVLLLNLLIAIFTYNISKLQDKEIKLWYIYRREVIFEYFHRPNLPQPFSLIVNVRDFIIWLRKMIYSEPVHCCTTLPSVFTHRMLCVYPDKSLTKHHLGKRIMKRVERWEQMMSNAVLEARRAADQSDSGYAMGEISKSLRELTKMQMLEDVSMENLDMKRKMDELETAVQRISKQLKNQREESLKSLVPKCEPCRSNCLACGKLVETDKFYFEDDGDVFFVNERIDCNTSGLVLGVTCGKCHAQKPIILKVLKGFSVVETPRSLPSGTNPRPREPMSGGAEDTRASYLKRTFRDVVSETLAAPPEHFDNEEHISEKHMRFVGIESLNFQKVLGISQRVDFWEKKCGHLG